MKFFPVLLLLIAIAACSYAQTSIYSFKLDSIAGINQIDFAGFKGKKILIVNTASGDTAASQYSELVQLKQLFKDSLVIVAIPSNSFNSETGSLLSIAGFYEQKSAYRFPVAAKLTVTGAAKSGLYKWLTQGSSNAVMDQEVIRPFQKYLINRNGRLTGVFSARERPMGTIIRNAIQNGY